MKMQLIYLLVDSGIWSLSLKKKADFGVIWEEFAEKYAGT
jgi:hypothetical protein